MAKVNKGAKAARTAAADARAQAQAAERARDRKVRTLGGIGVLVVMGGLLFIGIKSNTSAINGPVANAALPKGVSKDTFGIPVGSAWTAANAESIPKLQLWEDFQCPACGDFETQVGPKLKELVDAGKLKLEYRPTIFLDGNLSAQNSTAGNADSSLRATMALGCAVDQGKAMEYHNAIFALQPANEGDGFSTATLTSAASTAGIVDQGLATFSDCLTKKTYKGWVYNSYDLFSKEGNTSTPTGYLNGAELTSDVLFDPVALEKAITDATK